MNKANRTCDRKVTHSSEFLKMLNNAGVTVMFCSVEGIAIPSEHCGNHWLENLLVSSPMLLKAIELSSQAWKRNECRNATEAFPGVWIVPARCFNPSCRRGYAVGIIVTDDLLDSEYLNALCQASNADIEIIKEMIHSLPPVAVKDVHRIGSLFQYAFSAQTTRRGDLETIESIGLELSGSYEEISLLYTITGCMSSVGHPERFFELVCNELLQTMAYKYVCIQLNNLEKLNRIETDMFVVGEHNQSRSELSNLIRSATNDITPTCSIISDKDNEFAAELGNGTIIVPIVSVDEVIGVLVAGDKQGTDCMVSSVDIKLLSATAAQLAIFLENATLYEDLNATFIGTLEALTSSIDAKDRYTFGHSQRVALLTSELARAAGLNEEQINRFHISGLVHDIGKIGISENVLLKEGRLTSDEFKQIQMHPEIGARILKDIPHLEDVIEGVLSHHERFEGGGYPHGIAGHSIPLVARMIALADTFDAMSSSRTYRAAMDRKTVLAEIRRVIGTQFDPELAALFLELDFAQWEQLMLDHQDRAPILPKRKAA